MITMNHESTDDLLTLGTIMDANPVPCFVINASHQVVHWNKACEEILSVPADDMLGSTRQWQAFYPSARPTLADLIVQGILNNDDAIALYQSKALKRSQVIEDAFEACDFFPHMGSEGRWLFFTAAPIKDQEGKIIGAVETLQDITAQRQAEMALQKSHAELEQRVAERTVQLAASLAKQEAANRIKTDFLATVSHELKTPLNAIIGFSDLLTTEPLEASAMEFVQHIKDSGIGLLKLVENMLIMTELEAGEAECANRKFEASELLQGVASEYQQPARERHIALQCELEAIDQLIVKTDAKRLRMALGMVVDNAIRYMDRDDGEVKIKAWHDAEKLYLRICDNGPGIPAEREKEIFEKFRQLEGSITRRHGGLGLGLALSRAQLRFLGGDLQLETVSTEGQRGARFLLQIPLFPSQPGV